MSLGSRKSFEKGVRKSMGSKINHKKSVYETLTHKIKGGVRTRTLGEPFKATLKG
jgi:hypothetical protein